MLGNAKRDRHDGGLFFIFVYISVIIAFVKAKR